MKYVFEVEKCEKQVDKVDFENFIRIMVNHYKNKEKKQCLEQ